MKEKVTISLDICIPEHCYECPFWSGEETSFKVGDNMTACLFPQIPEWGRVHYEVFPPEDKECLCPLLKKAKKVRIKK